MARQGVLKCARRKDRVGDEPMGVVDGVLVSEMGLVERYDTQKMVVP